jgi:hypothetical protein
MRTATTRQGEYLQPNGQPLPVAPLVWYSADGDQWGEGGMPMRQVLEHDLEHFRTRSDLAEKHAQGRHAGAGAYRDAGACAWDWHRSR